MASKRSRLRFCVGARRATLAVIDPGACAGRGDVADVQVADRVAGDASTGAEAELEKAALKELAEGNF